MKILFGLITSDNDTQREQAAEAKLVSAQLGVAVETVCAEGDSVRQCLQLLEAIQSKSRAPNGIIFDPVTATGLPQVARAAVAAGIAWCVLDLRPSYLSELRNHPSAVVFGIGCDQTQVGRVQGRQLEKVLATGSGGNVLLIQGPSQNLAARARAEGFEETRPGNINVRILKGKWTEESGYAAVKSYLALSIARACDFRAVVAQSDMMAMGARRAFEEVSDDSERQAWLALPFLGADGLPKTGQAWVLSNKLRSTVIIPLTAGRALRMMVDAIAKKKIPPEYLETAPQPFPAIEALQDKLP